MNYLAVDIGNTRIHFGVFSEEGELLNRGFINALGQLPDALADYDIERAIVSSVRAHYTEPFPLGCSLIELSHHTPLPFVNAYKTPETLGRDRIAGMAGAARFFPDMPVLVFDMGTCITIDVLSPQGVYAGGNISPGMQMRFRALNHFTDGLPLVTEQELSGTLGDSTTTAIAAGVVEGIVYEMEGYIRQASEQHPGLKVILCGGDSIYFEKQLKSEIFAVPELVLYGLYHILRHND